MSDDDVTDEEALKAAAGGEGAGGEDDMVEEDEDKDPSVVACDDDEDDDDNGDDSSDTEGSKTDPPEMKKKMKELAKRKALAEAAKARKAKEAAERNASNSSKGGKKTKATDQGKQQAKRKKTGGRQAGTKNKATEEQEQAKRKDVADQTAATGRKEIAIKPGTKRSGNFSDEEDKILCRAWISITTSAIVGANQTAVQFWKAVEVAYCNFAISGHADDPNVLSRNAGSLKARFQKTILPAMNKFMRYYRQELAKKKSGVNEDDIIEAAMEKFAEMENGAFKFKHCVEILAAVPRFDATYTEKQVVELEADDGKLKANDVDGNMMGSTSTRPQGSKSAKSAEEVRRHRERTDRKRTAIQSRMADANFKIAKSLERKRKMDSAVNMVQMYMQMGNPIAAQAQMKKVEAMEKLMEEEDEKEKRVSRRLSLGSNTHTSLEDEEEDDDEHADIVVVGGPGATTAARIMEQTGLSNNEEVSQRNETNENNTVNSNGFPSPPPLGIVPI